MNRGQKAPPSPIIEAMRAVGHDELRAVEFMEARRWGGCPACPRCGSVAVYQMKDAATGARNRDFRWRCRDCAKLNAQLKKAKQAPKGAEMFTVRTGTVYEESRLKLWVWVHAFWSACSSKKGVSALQISRECQISYKSALFVMHRVRAAMTDNGGDRPKLSGTVEADETYVGGRPRNRGMKFGNKRGCGTKKTPVIGVVQRGGDVRLRVIPGAVTSADIRAAVREHVDASSRLVTDESNAYTKLGREFQGGHETVRHRSREYARGDIHSNTIEGVFSLLKRGMYGTFHSVSKKHLHRYVAEFEFRYNTRKLDDGQRAEQAIKASDGKRLTYAKQVTGP